MGRIIIRILLLPLNLILWPFRIVKPPLVKLLGKPPTSTVRKSSGNFIASKHDDHFREADSSSSEPIATQAAGIEALLFKQLERPRLEERSAPDLSLEEAKREVEHAQRFYTFQFSMFPRGDFFYEEVEQEFLHTALGYDNEATDARFIKIMTQFRRVLNDNSRRLFLYYTPFVFLLTLVTSMFLISANTLPDYLSFSALALPADQFLMTLKSTYIVLTFCAATVVLLILYHWPYKVTQQRNLLGLDNYITSKFARVNQNFLVAKRRGLNVERNKRMNQSDELKEEAGIWTLAYNWFAMRLFLCETLVRNKIYQIRRNTTLYSVGGIVVCVLIALGFTSAAYFTMSSSTTLPILVMGVSIMVFLWVAYSLIMGNAMPEILSVLHANEWARFNQAQLHKTIADHVGEDKLQIVTFRDRNRFE